MISKNQANQILNLVSNYAHYEAVSEGALIMDRYDMQARMAAKSTETWLKLKELVDGLTEE